MWYVIETIYYSSLSKFFDYTGKIIQAVKQTYFILGLVLFHTSHVWLNGTNTSDMEYNIEELSPGSDVSIYHYQIEDESYRDVISPDGTLRQAAAVWRGRRPAHILKGTKADSFMHITYYKK